jgi:hypothetical protein
VVLGSAISAGDFDSAEQPHVKEVNAAHALDFLEFRIYRILHASVSRRCEGGRSRSRAHRTASLLHDVKNRPGEARPAGENDMGISTHTVNQ